MLGHLLIEGLIVCYILSKCEPDICCQPIAPVRADGEDGLSKGVADRVPSSVEEAQRQKVPACRTVCPGEIDPCADADAVVHMLIEPLCHAMLLVCPRSPSRSDAPKTTTNTRQI